MSVILRLGAVNTDAPYSTLISDGGEYESPIDMSPVAEDPYTSPPQTYPGCFGLPYQDHNYGAPPPPTPPQTPPPPAPPKETIDYKEEIVVTTDVPSQLSPLPKVQEDDLEDPTRCICDFIHDDGYMIQCDKCSVWQHIACMGLDRDSIPDTYLCEECHPRPVDRVRAREFQIRKREFLKTLLITSHDSSTDTDPEEVNNRLKAYGLDPSAQNGKPKQKVKVKKRKERMNSKTNNKKLKEKEFKIEKENTNKEANKRNKLLVKDFSSKVAKAKKEKLSKKIEKMRAERLSKEMKEDKFSSEDLREDEKIINTLSTITAPLIQDENAQNPWDISSFNEWEQSYEVARYNQYTTYVQEYLNSTCINGHHNDIADLVTDGLRVQRCRIKELKNKKKGLEASCTIPDGQPVIEVIGKVMTRQQYDKDNFGQRQLSPFVFFYGKVFDLDLVIDASDYGNDARFIRRSCQPNAVVHHVVAGGQAHFIAVATKEVLEGTEITIPFDYDYKKWNFCVECACLRNNCPVSRYQKRRLRFQKLQINPSPNKKLIQHGKAVIKSPVKSPTKSQVKTTKSPEKKKDLDSPTPETIHVSEETTTTTTPSPTKMVRRSQVPRQNSNNASTQVSSSRVRSLRVPSQASDTDSTSVDPVTTPEPTALRSSEVDALTSPETHPNKEKESTTDTQQQEQPKTEKKKLTREERKMEAIMKAFEKMEKRNARKASVDQVKQKEKKEEKDEKTVKKDVKKEKEKEASEPVVMVKEEPVKVEETVEAPSLALEKMEVKCEVEEVTEVKPEVMEIKEDEAPRPTLRDRPPPKGKRAKKTASRRRTRNSSGASVSMEVKVEPGLEEDTSSNTCTSLPPQVTSCPATPVPAQEEITATPPSFRFLKTKRHLMNEWLHEKETDVKPGVGVGARSEPLEVSVGEESMFVTCLPSPRNSMDRLRRNSQSSRDHRAVVPPESTGGSAKKRWLRQAMGEGSESGTCSPVPGSGGMSPNPQTMHSPGGSPPIDFVTPLKKRRLARESLSRDSATSDPATPSPIVAPTTSYFAGLTETFEAKMENFRSKNGFNAAFSPIRPPSVNEGVASSNSSAVTAAVSQGHCESEAAANSTDSLADQPGSKVEEESHPVTDDKDHVSSCAEIDCSDTCNTGIEVSPSTGDAQISNMEVRSTSSGSEEGRRENSEQILVCDLEQSANSEPDSSVNVCQSSANTAMEVECDSGSLETSHSAAMEVVEEVDSTETSESVTEPLHTTGEEVEQSVASDSQQVGMENDQCDSCNSERIDSAVDSERQGSGTSPSMASSSTGTSRVVTGGSTEVRVIEPSDSSKGVGDRLPQVGSSTDQRTERSNSISESVSGSLSLQQAVESNVGVRTVSKFVSQHEDGNEAINSTEESVSTNVSPNSSRMVTLREPLSTSSHLSPEVSPVPNRHLKFLHDSHFTEMTVDSTTHSHFLSTVGTSNIVNSSGIHNLSYDSDSMDVTSASDVGVNGGLEDGRKSEDSQTSFPESSSSNLEPSQPKEKKKVSLQEYLKRKKDKPCGGPTPGTSGKGLSATSNVSSTVTTSPLKLTTPMSLEKLPPLPSLPSLPMFEKTERKEFKSSSEILSPIFNRKEKTEEVRKHMSLSERLRQEFGLDDSTDTDTDTENKSDPINKGAENHLSEQDVPPPPPPPPPQGQTLRGVALQGKPIPNGNVIPSLMSIKTFPTTGLLKQDPTTSTTAQVAPKMVPPPPGSMKLQPGAAGIPGIIAPSAPGKVPIGSPINTSLNTLLSSVKSPAQLQTDLTAQLAALKAQISKVQQALPIVSANNGGASSSSTSSSDQGIAPVNGVSTASLAPASYDYGHQGGNNFLRQNSYPSANSSSHYQGFNKTSPSLGFNKSPGFNKVSPRYGKGATQSGNQPYTNSVNSNGNQYNSAHHQNNISPSSWNQKHSVPHNHSASNRKHYSKQSSNKY